MRRRRHRRRRRGCVRLRMPPAAGRRPGTHGTRAQMTTFSLLTSSRRAGVSGRTSSVVGPPSSRTTEAAQVGAAAESSPAGVHMPAVTKRAAGTRATAATLRVTATTF